MTVEHLSLVWAAQGLSGNEKNLLLTCANLCTQKGLFSAGMERLTSMTGMSRNTVIRTREKLEARGLLDKRRHNNGKESLPNVYRLDVAALTALCPPEPQSFDDDAYAALFDLETEYTPSDQQISQLGTGGGPNLGYPQVAEKNGSDQQISQLGTGGGPNLGLCDDQQISQLGTHKEVGGYKPPPPTPSLEAGREFVAELPDRVLRQISEVNRARLAKECALALAAGHAPDALNRFLCSELKGAQSVYAVMTRRLRVDLPEDPLPPIPDRRTTTAMEPAERKPHRSAPASLAAEPGLVFVPTRLRTVTEPATDGSPPRENTPDTRPDSPQRHEPARTG